MTNMTRRNHETHHARRLALRHQRNRNGRLLRLLGNPTSRPAHRPRLLGREPLDTTQHRRAPMPSAWGLFAMGGETQHKHPNNTHKPKPTTHKPTHNTHNKPPNPHTLAQFQSSPLRIVSSPPLWHPYAPLTHANTRRVGQGGVRASASHRAI